MSVKLLKFFSTSVEMRTQGCVVLSFIMGSVLLSGCMSDVWTGASLVYDRHNVYKKISDLQLDANASHALYHDKVFKQDGSTLEIAAFNGDLLLVGRVPTEELRQEAYNRIERIEGKRRLFKQVQVSGVPEDVVLDNWITTKIRSHIFADSDIDPHVFKVVTFGGIVYLMGDVVPEQAARVILFASTCAGVKRVVKLLKYYNLSDQPAK